MSPRFIVVATTTIPLASLLPVMLAQLPLKEDMDEYEMVFKVCRHLVLGIRWRLGIIVIFTEPALRFVIPTD
jgi:hypothetical protein